MPATPFKLAEGVTFGDPTLTTEGYALRVLQQQGHVYAGTVPAGVVAGRRRKNRAARVARRITRRTR